MVVETKDNKLFIDAEDRYMGFHLTFGHACVERKYIAHLEDAWEDGDDQLVAEFRVENDRVVELGLKLEEDPNDIIWFWKLEGGCRITHGLSKTPAIA